MTLSNRISANMQFLFTNATMNGQLNSVGNCLKMLWLRIKEIVNISVGRLYMRL